MWLMSWSGWKATRWGERACRESLGLWRSLTCSHACHVLFRAVCRVRTCPSLINELVWMGILIELLMIMDSKFLYSRYPLTL